MCKWSWGHFKLRLCRKGNALCGDGEQEGEIKEKAHQMHEVFDWIMAWYSMITLFTESL